MQFFFVLDSRALTHPDIRSLRIARTFPHEIGSWSLFFILLKMLRNRHSTQAHAHFELNAAALCVNPTPPQSSTKRPFPLFQPRFFELDRTNSKSLVSMTTTHNGQVRNDERAVALALRLQVRPPFYLPQTYRGPGEGGNDREIRVIPLNCGQCRQCCGRQLNE